MYEYSLPSVAFHFLLCRNSGSQLKQNHIAHQLLTIYALGATPDQIQGAYDRNKTYQRPQDNEDEENVENLKDPATWRKCLGKQEYYTDFLRYFQHEMESKGWQTVVNEYLFTRDERAEDLLVRLFGGFMHPLIHLGFGVEFEQPAIMCEALAQTACHDTWIGGLLLKAEDMANEKKGSKAGETVSKALENLNLKSTKNGKSLPELLDEIQTNQKLKDSPHWEDGNKVRDGILKRDPDDMLDIASQFTVGENEIEKRMAEMMNAAGTSMIHKFHSSQRTIPLT